MIAVNEQRSQSILFALVVLLFCTPRTFAQEKTSEDTFIDPTACVFELMLPSEHLLFGDWGTAA